MDKALHKRIAKNIIAQATNLADFIEKEASLDKVALEANIHLALAGIIGSLVAMDIDTKAITNILQNTFEAEYLNWAFATIHGWSRSKGE